MGSECFAGVMSDGRLPGRPLCGRCPGRDPESLTFTANAFPFCKRPVREQRPVRRLSDPGDPALTYEMAFRGGGAGSERGMVLRECVRREESFLRCTVPTATAVIPLHAASIRLTYASRLARALTVGANVGGQPAAAEVRPRETAAPEQLCLRVTHQHVRHSERPVRPVCDTNE